ncbi:MAG: extracellular solute-binding protein [Clostridiaceae bacterium]
MDILRGSSRIIKKLLFSILPIFIFISLVSCNSGLPKLDKNKPVSLNFWHHYLGEQKVMFDNLIAEFNNTEGAEKGITVKAFNMGNTGDIHNMLMSTAKGEPGTANFPDMATAYPGTAFTLYGMDKLISLEKYMSEDELSMYEDSFLNEGRLTDDSGIVIFPISKSTEVLYINYTFYRQFIDDYNSKNPGDLLEEDMLSTFEGIEETAKAYYNWTDKKTPDKPGDGKAFYGFDAASNFAIAGFRQLGADFFTVQDDTGDIDLNNPAMGSIWNGYFAPMVKGYYGEYSFYRSEDVQTGDLVMYAGSTAGAGFFPKTVTYADNTKYDIELKVLPYPSFKNGKKVAVQQGAGVVVAKSAPEKEYASIVFLKWLTEPKRNVDFVLKTGYLPVTKEAIGSTLPKELNRIKDDQAYENVCKVLTTALDMTKTHDFYTYKPFEHSDDIRYAFEDKLLSYTKETRENFVRDLPSHTSFDSCVNDNITKQSFEQFLTEVRNDIIKAR